MPTLSIAPRSAILPSMQSMSNVSSICFLQCFYDPQQIDGLKTGAARLQRDLERIERTVSLQPPRPSDAPPIPPIGLALSRGHQKYTHIDVPVLAIYADHPHSFGPLYRNDPEKLAALVADDKATVSAQADAFQAGGSVRTSDPHSQR